MTFAATNDRRKTQVVFASMKQSGAKTQIAQGSELAIQGLQLWNLVDRKNATVGIDGGFFLMNSYDYDGLLVIDGQQISAKNHDHSGAVVVDTTGTVSLQRIDDVSKPTSAMQTGPFLVDPGGTMGIHSDDQNIFVRCFIAMAGDTVVCGMTAPLSLYQLADILMQYPDAFFAERFDAALNLGGSATASFYARVPKNDVRLGGGLNSPAILLFSQRPAP